MKNKIARTPQQTTTNENMRKKHHTHSDERIVKVEVGDLVTIEQCETCTFRGVPTRLGTAQNRCRLGMECSCLEKKKVANLVGAFYKGKTRDKNREDPSGFLMRICIFYCQER